MKTCKYFEKQLSAYIHGELYESDYHALREHLETCPACRAELEAQRMVLGLVGETLAAASAPGRIIGWRRLPRKAVDLRRNIFARIWFSPQFKAALATGVIMSCLFFISGLFVVFSVVNKAESEFCPPPPVARPKMKLRKLQVENQQAPKPKLSKQVVVKSAPATPEIEMSEVAGVRGGLGYDGTDDYFGGMKGESLAEESSQTFDAVAVSRPTMALKKPKAKVAKGAEPKPSSRIVAKIDTKVMSEIQLADLMGAGDGLLGGAGDVEYLDLPETRHVTAFGSAMSSEPEPAPIPEQKRDPYADPFADDSIRDKSAVASSFPSYGFDSGSMDDLFGGEDYEAGGSAVVFEMATSGVAVPMEGLSKDYKADDVALGRTEAGAWSNDSAPARERKPAVYNPYVMAADNAFSTFSIDVDTASYGLARQQLLSGSLPDTESVRTEEFINSFDYDYRPPAGGQTFAVHAEMAPSPFRRPMELLKVGIKGRRIGRDDHRNAILTLVIDTSGSMSTPERLGLVKQSLALLLDQLDPEDEVAIVQFGGDAHLVLEHTPAGDKAAVKAAIDSLQPGGPTQFDKGLELGYQLAADGFKAGGSNRIIVMSDGVANLGELDPDDILGQVADYRAKGIYLSVLGFGAGTYDDALLERLANRGDGMYAYVGTLDEAHKLFVDRLASTLHVIASDVKIQVEFNPDRVLRYRQLGYENRQLTKEQFRDDTVDAGEVGSGQSVTALYDVELKPGGSEEAPVATVYVRYRRADNGVVEEIGRRVTDADRKARFEDAGARFQLAACVAEFAEHLRRSPYAEGTTSADILGRLRTVLLDLDLDQQVKELQQLISIASGMEK